MQITFTTDDPKEAAKLLAYLGGTETPAPVTADEVMENAEKALEEPEQDPPAKAKKAAAKKNTKKTAGKKAAPEPETAADETDADSDSDDAPDAAPAVTRDEVGQMVRDAVKKTELRHIVALLQEFGVQKAAQLSEEDLPAFAERLRVLVDDA